MCIDAQSVRLGEGCLPDDRGHAGDEAGWISEEVDVTGGHTRGAWRKDLAAALNAKAHGIEEQLRADAAIWLQVDQHAHERDRAFDDRIVGAQSLPDVDAGDGRVVIRRAVRAVRIPVADVVRAGLIL